MRAKLSVVLVAGLLLAADGPGETPRAELKKLQGTWRPVSVTYNGEDVLADGRAKFTLVIKGDVGTLRGAAGVKKEYAKVKLTPDPSTTPKCLDVAVLSGGQKGVTLEAIYEIKEGKLRICAKVLGMDRPAKFASPAGKSIALIELERAPK
jgi:uncharacterized protein (TIGR03067 family)